MLKTIRHDKNPFTENMAMKVGKKSIRISALGRDSNVLINQTTGEVHGTHVVAHKKTDSTKFVKTFADYMSFTFDLSKSGNKALRVLMWAVKEQSINKDTVILDKYAHAGFLDEYSFTESALSYPTFARGLSELEGAKIIAKTMRPGHYFINPDCIFNGDRIAFTTVLERAK